MNPWLLIFGVAVGARVWAGQQFILVQPRETLWYSDPFQIDSIGIPGTRMFATGSVPPGEAPPWRLASETERQALDIAETS